MKESRKGTRRGAGHIWRSTPCNPNDGWITDMTERVSVLTWQFGSVHQCKVYIKYDNMKPAPGFDNDVGICLTAQPTSLAAMKHGVEWAMDFINGGVASVERMFADCYKHFPSLFRTRVDVLDHIFFVIGNGYEWLDGAIVCTTPEDFVALPKREKQPWPESFKKLLETGSPDEDKGLKDTVRSLMTSLYGAEEEEEQEQRPLPDDGGARVFYPVCDFSEIMRVPDDVRPEWLALAYEAAILLRDRSGVSDARRNKYPGMIENDEITCASNVAIGTRLVRNSRNVFRN